MVFSKSEFFTNNFENWVSTNKTLPCQGPKGIVEESSFCHWTVGLGLPVAAHLNLIFSPSRTTTGPTEKRGPAPEIRLRENFQMVSNKTMGFLN